VQALRHRPQGPDDSWRYAAEPLCTVAVNG